MNQSEDLVRIQIDDLAGPALAYAVSLVQNPDWDQDGHIANIIYPDDGTGWVYRPDIEWSQGGEILYRERIATNPENPDGSVWAGAFTFSRKLAHANALSQCRRRGPTPLVAGLRCLVWAEHGDFVDVPRRLLEANDL